MISSLLNIAYLMPIPLRAFFSAPPGNDAASGIREAPLPCLIAISITTVGCLALFFYPEPLYRLASHIGR